MKSELFLTAFQFSKPKLFSLIPRYPGKYILRLVIFEMIIAKGYEGVMRTLFPTTAEQWRTPQKVKMTSGYVSEGQTHTPTEV